MKKNAIPFLAAALAGSLATWLATGRPGPGGRPAEAGAPADPAAAPARTEAVAAPGQVMYNCAMHPSFIQDKPGQCPFCGMDLTPMAPDAAQPAAGTPGAEGGPARVRIDPVTVQNIGVRTAPVEKRALAGGIRASGKIALDEARQFDVNARVMGWAEKLHAATTGRAVRKGEPLLDLYSPELVSAQEEYLQALRYARTLGPAPESGSPGTPGHAAEAHRAASDLLESARRRLVYWGFPEAGIGRLEARGTSLRTIPIVAPAAGVILEKRVVQGQNVMPGMPLYRIADLSRVWVVASVYQGDLSRVKVGSPAEIALSHLPGRAFTGKVTFVSPVLDPGTRTAEVRVEAANTPALDLKPEMFATVTLRPAVSEPVVAVPEQSVIRSGRRNIAVVSTGDGYFEPREVVLGRAAEGWVEVLEGLHEGETLVVSSQFLIDSESNLKAAIRQMQKTDSATDAVPPAPDHGGHAP